MMTDSTDELAKTVLDALDVLEEINKSTPSSPYPLAVAQAFDRWIVDTRAKVIKANMGIIVNPPNPLLETPQEPPEIWKRAAD
jgi:hypothetical protein